jgi:REP element-mobilizing transposase RayT
VLAPRFPWAQNVVRTNQEGRLILAFHSIFAGYGFWLPNEPRGSWSDFVASYELYRFGPATTVTTRRSLAHNPYDRNLKHQVREALAFPPVRFTDAQIRIIAEAFAKAPYRFHALAILRDHVHAVLEHTDRDIRKVVGHLKSEATRALRAAGHFKDQRPWVDHGWNVYLDCDADVFRAVDYTNANPTRDGLAPQHWDLVIPYNPAHSRAARLGIR